MTEKCLIEIIPVPDDQLSETRIEISDMAIKQLSLQKNQRLDLICSRYSASVEIVSFKESDAIIHCSHSLLKQLKLPIETLTLSLQKIAKDKVSLGPIVCVLTEITESENRVSLGSIEEFCRELAIYSNQLGIFFYVMSLKGFEDHYGYIFIQNTWQKAEVPFPHVVHNRIHSRKKEHSTEFKAFVNELQRHNISYFNDHFLNKWEVHEILQNTEHLVPYLPDTQLLTNKSILNAMLEKHECIFVKPIHGSQGRNIYKISKNNDQGYFLDYTTISGEIESVYPSFNALFQSVKSRFQQNAFIVQECLSLLLYHEKPLDFRILCQKQKNERWQITSIISRVSSMGQFVSNVARGGEIKKVNEVLIETFEIKSVPHIKEMMKELALEVATVVDLSTDGIYAELGIDLALNHEGNPAIIEVNTKPSKNQGQEQFNTKIRPSAKAIIQHCLHLANQ